MKSIFLALLLANLLFVGWRLWIAPPEVLPRQLHAGGQEPGLQAARPRQDEPGGSTRGEPGPGGGAGPAPAQSADAPDGVEGASCTRIGPVADREVADKLHARLAGRSLQVSTVVESGRIWVGHWVQLESVPTREAADQIVARLVAGGLPDAYVLQSAPPFSVSLGVFRDKERADTMAAKAAALGFRTELVDRYRSGTQYWLLLPTVPGHMLRLDDLAREAGQILRAETVICRPDPVGAAEPIH